MLNYYSLETNLLSDVQHSMQLKWKKNMIHHLLLNYNSDLWHQRKRYKRNKTHHHVLLQDNNPLQFRSDQITPFHCGLLSHNSMPCHVLLLSCAIYWYLPTAIPSGPPNSPPAKASPPAVIAPFPECFTAVFICWFADSSQHSFMTSSTRGGMLGNQDTLGGGKGFISI